MKKGLADSEWIILKSLWGRPPQTMKQIVMRIHENQPEVEWGYKTYHTYLRNMCEKGLIQAEERNLKDKLYSPRITKDEALQLETESILNRSDRFGSVGRLVMMMAENGQLTEQDQQELMELAQRLEKKAESEDE